MTQVAHGLGPDGLLLLDVKINGMIPESLAEADLQVQVLWAAPPTLGRQTHLPSEYPT